MYDMESANTNAEKARKELKDALREQIEFRRRQEHDAKQRRLSQERRYLEHVQHEAEEHRAFQAMQAQRARKDLMESWNREVRLRETVRKKENEGRRGRRIGGGSTSR